MDVYTVQTHVQTRLKANVNRLNKHNQTPTGSSSERAYESLEYLSVFYSV